MSKKSSRTELVISAVDKASATINAVSDRLQRAVRPVDNLKAAFGRFYKTSGAQGVVSSLGNVTSAMGGLIKRTLMLNGALAGGAAFLVRFGLSGVQTAVQLSDLAGKHQVLASSLQFYGKLAAANGSSMEQTAVSMGRLKKAMHEALHGGKEQIAAFAGIGISVKELKKLKPEEVITRMADAFRDSNREGQKQAVLKQLLGSQDLMAVLNKGSGEIEAFRKQLAGDGQLFSEDEFQRAQQFDSLWTRLTGTLKGFKDKLGIDLMEVLGPSVEKLQQYLVENSEKIRAAFREFIDKLPEFIDDAVDFFKRFWEVVSLVAGVIKKLYQFLGPTLSAFAALGAVFGPLLASLVKLGWSVGVFAAKIGTLAMQGLPALMSTLKAVWAVMKANPMMLLMASVAAVAVLIYSNWDSITAYIRNAWERIKGVFQVNFFDGLIQVWLQAWQGLGNSILGIIKSILPDALLPKAVKNLKFDFADKHADRIRGVSPTSPSGQKSVVSAAEAAKSKTEVGGTLKIEITGNQDSKITKLEPAGSAMDIDVSTGPAMTGA